MAYWLMKSEPETFSIDDLAQAPRQTTSWEGVRNYQARNFMRDDMALGDKAFFYHSNCKPPGIAGIVEVVACAHPDLTAFDSGSEYFDPKSNPENPRWMMVDVRLVQRFERFISLSELKQQPELNSMKILEKGNRLSITPVSLKEWRCILQLSNN